MTVAFIGTDAVRIAAAEKPDVILRDIGLPDINRFEVAQRLRSDAALHDTLILSILRYVTEDDRRHGKDVGFAQHFLQLVDLHDQDRTRHEGSPAK